MGYCPICYKSANLEQPPGGDYRRVECRKCGRFQITGTALTMLASRLSVADKRTVARLSHATRLMSASASSEWPEINSINLDPMLNQPLPSVDRQMTNLLVWAAAQLDDDQLGTLELPDEDDLTAVLGTVDGDRVDDLISRAEKDGLIEFRPTDCIVITTKGWSRLKPPPPPPEETPNIPPALGNERIERVIKAHCNKCRGPKNSWVRAEYKRMGGDDKIDWSNKYEVVECCGCNTLSVRHEEWFSEWDYPGVVETYYPPPTVRPKPTWSDAIGDEVLRDVLSELYAALDGGLKMLASVGARTLLDRAGYLLIGDPRGGFEGKLSALFEKELISLDEKNALEAVADAGNASAHRGYAPTSIRLGQIVDIIENFLHRAFVLKPVAEDIRRSTPPRK